jgi:hypothetical protein
VEAALADGQGGLANGLGEGRVGVRRTGDILGAGAELDGQPGLGDEIGCPGSEDVDPEDAVASSRSSARRAGRGRSSSAV